MSILIRGIKMPKEGTVFVIDSTGQVWSNEWPTRGYTRLDGATAVPVPPHGRSIDADALIKDIEADAIWQHDAINEYDSGIRAGAMVIMRLVRNAPTIIPADPAGEGE